MKKKEKQKKSKVWQQYIAIAFFMLIGAVCGYIIISYSDRAADAGRPLYERLQSAIGLLFGMYAAIIVQLIIHEAGHLVFGLLSGYKFNSFCVFSFMWVKENGKIRFRRFSIAGTAGQCLMAPPDMVDGKIPLLLYNLGGSLMNIFSGMIFLGLFFIFKDILFLSSLLLLFSVVGFVLAAMNGVPMRMGMVDNDGYNAVALTRSREAMRSFGVQMKVNEQISKGVRLKDMPEEWFVVPSDEAMKNSMVAATGVFACNRLMDEGKYDEANKLMAHMLEIDSDMVGLHRNLLICDRVYVELITENRREVLDSMLTEELGQFMRAMKNSPSILRTKYAYALLCEKDNERAERIKSLFEKCAKTYPCQSDIVSERELMELAEKRLELSNSE